MLILAAVLRDGLTELLLLHIISGLELISAGAHAI